MGVICGVIAPGGTDEFRRQVLAYMTRKLDATVLKRRDKMVDGIASLAFFEHPRLKAEIEESDFYHPVAPGIFAFGCAEVFNPQVLETVSNPALGGRVAQLDDLLEKGGGKALATISGDFCFGRYHARENRLTLARDHIGHKTFYYCRTDFGFLFASIAQPVADAPGVSEEIDEDALLAFLVMPHPGKGFTFLKDVREVEAASICKLDSKGEANSERYWRAEDAPIPKAGDPSELLENLEVVLREVVSCRMSPDANDNAIQLSGGLDSSSIAALMCEAAPQEEILAISSVLPRGHDLQVEDERIYIESVLKRWPNLVSVEVRDNADLQDDPHGFWHEWFRAPNPDPFHGLNQAFEKAQEASGRRALFLGVGGDEAVSGWANAAFADFLWSADVPRLLGEIHRLRKRYPNRSPVSLVGGKFLSSLTPMWARRLRRFLSNTSCYEGMGVTRIEERPRLMARLAANHHPCIDPWPKSMREHEILNLSMMDHYNMPAYDFAANLKGYRMRYPFLDFRLFEAVLAMPAALKVSRTHDRMLLRTVLGERLPVEVRMRTGKLPFQPDFQESLMGRREELMDAIKKADQTVIMARIAKHLLPLAPEATDDPVATYFTNTQFLRRYALARFAIDCLSKVGKG